MVPEFEHKILATQRKNTWYYRERRNGFEGLQEAGLIRGRTEAAATVKPFAKEQSPLNKETLNK